jgi:segregation and condensation protein A
MTVGQSFQVHLAAFTGSLADLAQALRDARVNAKDIDLLQLVRDYLHHYRAAAESDLEHATETLPDMARIIEIKTRLLLPKPPSGKTDDLTEDVVAVVLELDAIEDALVFLRQQRQRRAQVMAAHTPRPDYPRKPRPLTARTLQNLRSIASKHRISNYFEVAIERLSIPQAMRTLKTQLQRVRRGMFSQLVATHLSDDPISDNPVSDDPADVQTSAERWLLRAVYFAGMLELIKEGTLRAHQASPQEDIVLEWCDDA